MNDGCCRKVSERRSRIDISASARWLTNRIVVWTRFAMALQLALRLMHESIPASVTASDQNDFNPSIGGVIRLSHGGLAQRNF